VRIGTHAVPSCDTRSSLDWGRQSNNYFDFGKQTLSSFVAFGAAAPVVTGVTLLRDHHTQVHTLKVGINYLFGPAPVVAKYWARQGLSIGRSVAPATGVGETTQRRSSAFLWRCAPRVTGESGATGYHGWLQEFGVGGTHETPACAKRHCI
jgi:hypothetical protein